VAAWLAGVAAATLAMAAPSNAGGQGVTAGQDYAAGAEESAAATTPDGHPANATLVFHDEFGGSKLNRNRWCTRYQYGGGPALPKGTDPTGKCAAGTLDFLNDEVQRYRDTNSQGQPLHVVKGGILRLIATQTGSGSANWESAMIRSLNTFRPSAGKNYYITARVKLPDNLGSWPAFWLVPDVVNGDTQWPPEIDMLESPVNNKDGNANNMHIGVQVKGGPQGGQVTYASPKYKDGWYAPGGKLRGTWHEVGIDWTPTSATVYVDRTKVVTYTYTWVDDSKNAANLSPVLLNLAVGGSWAGSGGIGKGPMTYGVDHVRVYQRS
jgi:beta-glucanase (GH16 family)